MTFQLSISDIAATPYSSAHFGGNLLATSDIVGENGTFDDTAAALNITFLRYPGGALTESCACIYEADRLTGEQGPSDTSEVLLPLTEMFAYASEVGMALTIVLPTREFLSEETDASGNRLAAVDEDGVRQFIRDVAEGKFGTTPEIQAFEIGNEYWGSGEMNAVEYGRVATKMAVIVNNELSRQPNADSFAATDILVQMGANIGASDLSEMFDGTAEQQLAAASQTFDLSLSGSKYIYSSGEVAWTKVNNAIIMSQFDTETERDAIDGVVAHIYSRGEDVPGSRYFELSQIKDTWLEEMPELSVYATEWNLKRSVGDTRNDEFGLKQAHEMLNIVEAFEWGGVDAAHVWAVQLNSRTALAGVEGEADMRVAGEMFRLMNKTLPGTRPLSLDGSQGRETELEGVTADVHVFFADNRLVTFLASTSNETEEQIVDFNNLVTDAGQVSITRLGVAPGENPTTTTAEPQVTEENTGALFSDGALISDLAPREILVIEMFDPSYTEDVLNISGGPDQRDDDLDLPIIPPEEPESNLGNPPLESDAESGGDDAGLFSTLIGVLPLLLFAG